MNDANFIKPEIKRVSSAAIRAHLVATRGPVHPLACSRSKM